MIKKLRQKFVAIIMSIVTIMLVIILVLIFHFTKLNLETQSIDMIETLAEQPFALMIPNESSSQVRLPYFTLQIGPTLDVVATGGSYYDLSDIDFLTELIVTCYNSPQKIGIIEEYNLRYCIVDTTFNRFLIFTDISSELATINNLLKTCVFIGLLSFCIFLFFSVKLSKWVVAPIETALNEQKQFISDASHELKTPLTIIMTNAELLQSESYHEVDKITLSNNIIVTSNKMKTLVEKMLKLSMYEDAKENIVLTDVDFSKLISQTLLPFEPVFFEKGLTLNYDIEKYIHISGQEDKLKELVEILVDNACKYSITNGNTIVSLKRKGEKHAILYVSNQGLPLSAHDTKNIFKRFYCADNSRNDSSSFGLGLSIAQTTVLNHKGKITVESDGVYNHFKVTLPIK